MHFPRKRQCNTTLTYNFDVITLQYIILLFHLFTIRIQFRCSTTSYQRDHYLTGAYLGINILVISMLAQRTCQIEMRASFVWKHTAKLTLCINLFIWHCRAFIIFHEGWSIDAIFIKILWRHATRQVRWTYWCPALGNWSTWGQFKKHIISIKIYTLKYSHLKKSVVDIHLDHYRYVSCTVCIIMLI